MALLATEQGDNRHICMHAAPQPGSMRLPTSQNSENMLCILGDWISPMPQHVCGQMSILPCWLTAELARPCRTDCPSCPCCNLLRQHAHNHMYSTDFTCTPVCKHAWVLLYTHDQSELPFQTTECFIWLASLPCLCRDEAQQH